MSYLMDFESAANVRDDDNVMTYDDAFQLVCDSKSLLYLFGLRLDYRCVLTSPAVSQTQHRPNGSSRDGFCKRSLTETCYVQ